MTVEQLAEQYAENVNLAFVADHTREAFEQAYIAGYNEAQNTITQCNRSALSGVKWHKVADGDLPKECTDVLAIDILAGKPSEPSLYHFVTSDTWEWLPKRIACLSNEQMLAWCEIPTFTE